MARKAKPLPGELQSYMCQSINGVILVSFGTVITELPPDVIKKLLKACHIPSNVRIMSWVPKNDLLAHPNLKLFITHCGLSSIIETLYHGVPLCQRPIR